MQRTSIQAKMFIYTVIINNCTGCNAKDLTAPTAAVKPTTSAAKDYNYTYE